MTASRKDPQWFWARAVADGECLVWGGYRMKNGYGVIDKTLAHRAAWELTNGPIPAGMHICHRCDNPPCVKPEHLFLGTRSDNLRDCVAKGRNGAITHPERIARGEQNGSSKLKESDVVDIRKMLKDGVSPTKIAKQKGVSRGTIQFIADGVTWKCVGAP